ncbi:hypothetical protein PVK06_029643 [Gossypium arboreum]|uniref:Uncharacterized protein n=1 Tax=Gossypium arboreum TaxID=29729 RepID=A0ABR0NL49_GOSAR|nr:hypothetical protein PVK06_029643 [Gossypium arboreum]
MDKVRDELESWQYKPYKRMKNQIRGLERKIDQLVDGPNRDSTTNLLKMAHFKLGHLYVMDEGSWAQRAHIKWLTEGDGRSIDIWRNNWGFDREIREQICKIPIIPNGHSDRKGWFHNPYDCPNARKILVLGGLNNKILIGNYIQCIDWIEDVMWVLDLKVVSQFMTTLWNSWNNRNNFIFRGKEE